MNYIPTTEGLTLFCPPDGSLPSGVEWAAQAASAPGPLTM